MDVEAAGEYELAGQPEDEEAGLMSGRGSPVSERSSGPARRLQASGDGDLGGA